MTGKQPPPGNTGAEITPALRVGLGWLSCTFLAVWDAPREVSDWLDAFIGGELEPLGRKWRMYHDTYEGPNGVRVGCHNRPEAEGGLEVHIDFPAACLDSMTDEARRFLLGFVARRARNVTRLDVSLDDFEKLVTPRQLDALTCDPGDYEVNHRVAVTKAASAQLLSSRGPRSGDTWYLGKKGRGVKKLLRVYDKARESGGEIDAIRWELQLRDEAAHDAVLHLALGGDAAQDRWEEMGIWAAEQIVAFVDFRDRSASSNVTRCPRLPWFARLVGNARRASRVTVPPPTTIERMHEYAQKALPSWFTTLVDSADHVGMTTEQYIRHMLQKGRERRSRAHTIALRQWQLTP